jgi:hypothetical protein
MARNKPVTVPLPTASSLSRLLETEARLDALLSRARTEAEQLVREAEARAKARLDGVDRELAAAVNDGQPNDSVADSSDGARRNEESRRSLDRLGAIGDERIAELALWVVQQILAESGRTEPVA